MTWLPSQYRGTVISQSPKNVAISTITPNSEYWGAFVPQGNAGLPVPTERSALALTAVYACVNLISGAIMSVPLECYRREPDGDLIKLEDDPLWWVLNEAFSARWAASAAWDYATKSLLLQGDAFIEIKRDPLGQVRALVPLHPSRVFPVATPDGERLVYAIYPEDTPSIAGRQDYRVLDQDDVLHVPGFGFDGTRGLSVLRHALRNAGGLGAAMQDYAGRFFANGARPDYTINSEKALSPDRIDELYSKLESYQGFDKAHRPMVLTGGLKVTPIAMPLAEMQLLESRKFQIEEICRIYGVPPFMVGHTEKTTSWGSGVESMGIGFVRYTLRPTLTRFETELNRKLFRQGRKCIRFDTADLERADIKTMMEAIRVGLGRAGERPIITQNEGRRMMRLADMPGGDTLEPTPAANPQPSPGA